MSPEPMTTASSPEHPLTVTLIPGRAQQHATRLIFLLSGFAMAAWAPLVPFVKLRLAISDGTLGLLLLCIGAGSTFSMPLTGFLTGKLGCKTVILIASVLLLLALPLLTLMDSTAGMAVVLLVFGAAIGMIDVAMNVHADSGRESQWPRDDVRVSWLFQYGQYFWRAGRYRFIIFRADAF